MKKVMKAEQRFIDGTGERYLPNGRVRCQAVNRNKIKALNKALRAETGDPTAHVNAEDYWPELQCKIAARDGYYVCKFHGAGKEGGPGPGRSPAAQMKNLTKYMNKTLADKYIESVTDPELLDQKQNIALLMARNAELLQQMTTSSIGDTNVVDGIRKAIIEIRGGDVRNGADRIENLLNGLHVSEAAWDEIRDNAKVMRELTVADMARRKEERLTLTAEQVKFQLDQLVTKMIEAVEKYVQDPATLDKIYQYIIGGYRDTVGHPTVTILPKNPEQG